MALQVGAIPFEPELLAILVPGSMALVVAGFLVVLRPPVTKNLVLAFTPWMVVGAATHALYTIDAYPEWAKLLFDPVSVYLITFTAAGMVWACMNVATQMTADVSHDAQYVAGAGFGAALVTTGYVLSQVQGAALSRVLPSFGGLVVAAVVAIVAYVGVGLVYSKMIIHADALGWLVVFGHALDGVMAAIAVDLFGYDLLFDSGRRIVRYSATLPTEQYVGSGWLLVAAKVALALAAVGVVAALLDRGILREREWIPYLFLGLVAAYGLGPGVHRLFTLVLFG